MDDHKHLFKSNWKSKNLEFRSLPSMKLSFFHNVFYMPRIVIFQKGALNCSAWHVGSLFMYKGNFTDEKISCRMFKTLSARPLLLFFPLNRQMLLKNSTVFCRCSLTIIMPKASDTKIIYNHKNKKKLMSFKNRSM